MIKNNNVPDSTIIKCLIRDNRCLIADIAQLEQKIEVLTKEFDAKMLKNPELLRRIVSDFDYQPLLDENTSNIKNLQIHIAK